MIAGVWPNTFAKKLAAIVLLLPSTFGLFAASVMAEPDQAEQTRTATVHDLARLVDIGGGYRQEIAVSPNGELVAFLEQRPDPETDTFDQRWIVVSIDGDAPVVVAADGGEVILDFLHRSRIIGSRPPIQAVWSPDSEWIVFPKRTNGIVQLWRARADGGHVEQLTYGSRTVVPLEGGSSAAIFSADGTKLFYQLGRDEAALEARRDEEARRGFLFDDRFMAGYARAPLPPRCGAGPFGYVTRSIASYPSESESEACEISLGVVDLATGETHFANEEEMQAYLRLAAEAGVLGEPALTPESVDGVPLRALRDSDLGVWTEKADPDTYQGILPPGRIVVRTNEGDLIYCKHAPCRARYLSRLSLLGILGDEILFRNSTGHNDTIEGLYRWNPLTNELRTVFESDRVLLNNCEQAHTEIICLSESWTEPPRIVAIDDHSGRRRTIYDPNPEWRDFRFSRIDQLNYFDPMSNDSHAHLVYPIDYDPAKSYPLVIIQYLSRGFLRGGVGDEHPIHPLAAKGFFVLSFERPIHRRFLRDGEKRMDWSKDRQRQLDGLMSVLNLALERAAIDPMRIGITGLSNGAETTNYALIHSDRFAAATAADMFWSPSVYYFGPSDWRDYVLRIIGHPIEDQERWSSITLGLNSEAVLAPLLVNVPETEFYYSLSNYVSLKDADRPVEMHVFPGAHHIKSRPVQRLNMYRRNTQWMAYWLQGEISEDPVDSKQYARWSALCEQHVANLRASDNLAYRERADRQFCSDASQTSLAKAS